MMTERDQLDHIADGDFCWCDECGGSGRIERDGEPSYLCGFCNGDGIVYSGDEMEDAT